jgi:hypothetical protein
MMARDTITVQFRLQAQFETIQAIRRALADEAAQTALVSLMSETATDYLTRQTKGDFQMRVALKVSPVPQTRRGPRAVLPKVEHGVLSWYDEYEKRTNTVGPIGSANYVAWLEDEWTRSFRYESDLGSFTAIKENRRGRRVWYAHRRRGGQLKRVYLGKSENLTVAKLSEAVRKLNSKEAVSLTTQ